jgi:hypothetical protein
MHYTKQARSNRNKAEAKIINVVPKALFHILLILIMKMLKLRV